MDPATWLVVDDAFAGQMVLRERLIDERRDDVHALLPEARPAAQECLDAVLAFLKRGDSYEVGGQVVTRPDGARVEIDRQEPLLTLGRLLQEDICVMLPGEGEHLLGGAILCFPALWTLSEKIGRPLLRIHKPVESYHDGVARRVQRLFDGIRPDRPMWRANAHLKDSPALFTPKLEGASDPTKGANPPFLRSERQTLMRLPETGAVIFSIHTWMVAVENLSAPQLATLDRVRAQYGQLVS
jgi:hypothetical protein